MLTKPSPPLRRWSTLVISHDGRTESPLTSCGISCRRMAIVVRNPTCSRGEKVIRKQSPSSERWAFHQHVKAPFSKLRFVTRSLELFNKRVDELTLPLMPVQMTNMSQVWRSSAEGQDRVAFYYSLHFLRNFQKKEGTPHIFGFFACCITLENRPLQFSIQLVTETLPFC